MISSFAATSLSTADLNSYIARKIDHGQIDIVFDTGTKESVCNNKSLFVGEIAPLTGVSLNGVGWFNSSGRPWDHSADCQG